MTEKEQSREIIPILELNIKSAIRLFLEIRNFIKKLNFLLSRQQFEVN